MFIVKAKRVGLTLLIVGMLLIANCGTALAVLYSIGGESADGGSTLLLVLFAGCGVWVVGNEIAMWLMGKDAQLDPGHPQKELIP